MYASDIQRIRSIILPKSKFCAAVVTLAVGCGKTANQADHAAKLQEYVNGWDRMGMWLPEQNQIDFFRLCLPDSQKQLKSALSSPAYEVRMSAAYVIDNIGPDAIVLGPALVRMYLYPALRKVGYDERSRLLF
jgi:hypothetical protein